MPLKIYYWWCEVVYILGFGHLGLMNEYLNVSILCLGWAYYDELYSGVFKNIYPGRRTVMGHSILSGQCETICMKNIYQLALPYI